MGCGDSRGLLTAEEAVICSAEKKLKLKSLAVAEVCSTIKRFSGQEVISESQLLRICQRLVPDLDDYHVYKHRFFGQSFFHADPHGFSRVKVSILGLLLSKGTNEDKSRELFYIINPECTPRLDQKQVESLVQGLVSVSVIYCPLLVKEVSPGLAEYKRMLERKAALVTEHAVDYLEGGCTLPGLIERFNSKELSRFLTPSGIRRTLIEFTVMGEHRPRRKSESQGLQ